MRSSVRLSWSSTGGVIASIATTSGPVEVDTLVPGFVDLQVNGIDYIDVATASGNEWTQLDQLLLAAGRHDLVPTLITAPLDSYAAVTRGSRRRPGATDRARRSPVSIWRDPSSRHRERTAATFLRPSTSTGSRCLPTLVRLVTLAPELAGAIDAIHLLAGRDVLVALGHTHASPDAVGAATTAGARMVTHLFNAMSGLHHREPASPAPRWPTTGSPAH